MNLTAAAVLALHQRRSTGMTYDSPDVCTCGARLFPERGDEDATIRRDRALAHHQAQALTAATPRAPEHDTPALDREALALARAAVEGPEPGPREVVPAVEYVRLARAALAAVVRSGEKEG